MKARIRDVKNFRLWSWVGVAGLVLSGCGGSGGDSSSNASLRVVNATLTHASIDLLVNSTVSASATASDTASAYVSPASGSVTLQINDAGAGTALATSVPTLTGGNHYTMVVYESGSTVKTVILNEDFATPASGVATLRLVDVAPEAGKLDVYVTTNACTNLTGVASSYTFASPSTITNVSLTQGAGTYNVCVTASGNVNDLRMSQAITVASQQIATVVMTPTSGGQLLNGALLVQQGAYTASRNTNARVRLAAAVTGSNAVALSAGSTVVDTLAAPGLSFQYKLVPAGSTLSGTIGGVAYSTASKPAVGQDVTLLVYGNPASPTVTLLTDDNRLPTDGSTKMRLINGITGNVGALTLTANGAVIGTGVAPGAASGYASPTLSTSVATTLKLISTTNANLLSDNTNVLSPNAAYTILAGGDVSAPLLLVR
jgi:Domain of unknown function (DUF4397)